MPFGSTPPPRLGPPKVLIVDEDDRRRRAYAELLNREGYDVEQLEDGDLVVDRVVDEPPDLLLLEVELLGGDGFEICGELRMIDEARLTPIILVGEAAEDESVVVRGLLSGADDVCAATRLGELKARVRAQLRNRRDRELLQWARQQKQQYRSAALNDALTGIPNRRGAEMVLVELIERAEPFVVILLDVDHFKKVNDTWGHAAGDEVLKGVARSLERQARRGDTVARFGGEEFVLLLQGAGAEQASPIAERFRAAIEATRYDCEVPQVTASFGVVVWDGVGPAPTATRLLALADEALYEAKRSGRNRCRLRTITDSNAPHGTEMSKDVEEKVA